MSFPLYNFGAFNEEISLVVAFLIGLGFGFFLERGGLGNASKLTAQFYFKDLSVFKVMFTAIVTAMIGVYIFTLMGWLDLSQVFVGNTYLMPQLIGGLMLGAGFIIGGYCPGTSIVSFATGKIDAIVYILGVFFGIFVFGQIYPSVEGFYLSTNMGELTLYNYFGISYGTLVFAVIVMALLGFWGSEVLEKKMAKPQIEEVKNEN